MSIAALITWLVAAVGGFYLLITWVSKGGLRGGTTRFPAGLVFGHFLLAAAGLVVWLIFLISDEHALSWVALVVIAVTALAGFGLFARWLGGRSDAPVAGTDVAAERHFPVAAVLGHGLIGAATLVLVLLVAILK